MDGEGEEEEEVVAGEEGEEGMGRRRVRWFMVRVENWGEKRRKKEVKRGVRKLVWLAEQLLSLPSTPSLAPHPSLPRSALYSVEMTGGKLYCSEFVSIGAPQRG